MKIQLVIVVARRRVGHQGSKLLSICGETHLKSCSTVDTTEKLSTRDQVWARDKIYLPPSLSSYTYNLRRTPFVLLVLVLILHFPHGSIQKHSLLQVNNNSPSRQATRLRCLSYRDARHHPHQQ